MSDKAVFRCPEELKGRVEALAKIRTRKEGEEVSASDIYRRAVKLYLRHKGGSAPTFVIDKQK